MALGDEPDGAAWTTIGVESSLNGGPGVPLYMDRHDVPGATAADVAQAHLLDVQVGAKHDVRFLTYWFDADAGAAFCFASAPAPRNLQEAHAESHGLIPNEIIAVSEDSVLRFLGRIHDPTTPSESLTAFRAVVFTDLVDSTAMNQAVGDAAFMVLLSEHDLIVRKVVAARRGREVKHTGDGFLLSFDDVGVALAAALDIQRGFAARPTDPGTPRLRVRIGVDAGEPVQHNDDLFGATVNRAARLCQAAQPDQVLVSEDVRRHPAVVGFRFVDAGTRSLKGFAGQATAYELESDQAG